MIHPSPYYMILHPKAANMPVRPPDSSSNAALSNFLFSSKSRNSKALMKMYKEEEQKARNYGLIEYPPGP